MGRRQEDPLSGAEQLLLGWEWWQRGKTRAVTQQQESITPIQEAEGPGGRPGLACRHISFLCPHLHVCVPVSSYKDSRAGDNLLTSF